MGGGWVNEWMGVVQGEQMGGMGAGMAPTQEASLSDRGGNNEDDDQQDSDTSRQEEALDLASPELERETEAVFMS